MRIPAAFNNAFGLRPTSRRLPYGRALNTIMGQEMVESVLGPMSSNLAGCVSFVRGVLASSPWDIDPAVVPIPWRSECVFLPVSLPFSAHSAQTIRSQA